MDNGHGAISVLPHDVLLGVLDFLGALDVYAVARQVNARLSVQLETYYWKSRTDTACVAGMRLNAWFGGSTGLCRCKNPSLSLEQLACTERLQNVTVQHTIWSAYGVRQTGWNVAWAGPTVDYNLPPQCRHTVVVCENGGIGVLSNSMHQGWLLHPVHMINVLRIAHAPMHPANSVRYAHKLRKFVVFGAFFLGMLCGQHMIVLRLSVMPVVYANWALGTPLTRAVDVAVCDATRAVVSACSTGVLCVQRYRFNDDRMESSSTTGMQITAATEAMPNRSVRMLAVMHESGLVLARDYANPRLLRLLRLHDDDTVSEVDRVALKMRCTIVQLATLRFGRGVGVVCERADDTASMCWFVASVAHNNALIVQLQAPGWQRCPEGRLVDVGPASEHARLVSGGGMLWETGDPGTLLAQPSTCNVPRRVSAPWRVYA